MAIGQQPWRQSGGNQELITDAVTHDINVQTTETRSTAETEQAVRFNEQQDTQTQHRLQAESITADRQKAS